MQMILLLQTEATSKIEVETQMASLTETQLNMLTQVSEDVSTKLVCNFLLLFVVRLHHYTDQRDVL